MTCPLDLRHLLAASALAVTSFAVWAAPTAMSPEHAQGMCKAWNDNPTLTTKLVESGWVKNDSGRGHKVMQIYRSDCAKSPRVELQVGLKDGKAQCLYGGAARSETLVESVDYLMWADSSRWQEMGRGELGPMKAMMMGRLNFEGPKFEAMGNMAPFEQFLLLVGKVEANWGACP